ncbi:hypothetical protein BH11PLA1_BH11PLA1_01980 [soil metagenome]
MVGGKSGMSGINGWVRGAMFVMGAAALIALGGCKASGPTVEDLTKENEGLRAEKQSMDSLLLQTQAQAKQAELERDQARAQANVQPPMQPYSDPGDTGRGPGQKARSNGPVVLKVAGDVAFAAGSTNLNAAGKKELDGIAKTIKSQYSGHNIRIEGYTDSDPVKKNPLGSNQAISAARASAVEKYLVTKGIAGSRMESVGMGSAKPKKTKADSRRVEIVILGT